MPRVPREVIGHLLGVDSDVHPIRQKIRRKTPERQGFICEQVQKMLDAGFIREVLYPEWLANPVVVPKANGKLHLCLDYNSTKLVRRIHTSYPTSIRWSILPWDATSCTFWTRTLGTTKSAWHRRMKRRRRLPHPWGRTITSACPWAEERWSHLPADHADDPKGFPTACRRGLC